MLFIYYTKLSDVRCIGYDTIICRYNNENGTNNDLYCECYNQPVNVLISTKLNNLHHTIKNWLLGYLTGYRLIWPTSYLTSYLIVLAIFINCYSVTYVIKYHVNSFTTKKLKNKVVLNLKQYCMPCYVTLSNAF